MLDLDLADSVRRQSDQKLVEVDTIELFISMAVGNRNLESLAAGPV